MVPVPPFPRSFCLCQYRAQAPTVLFSCQVFLQPAFSSNRCARGLLQQVLSAAMHLMGRLSTIGTLIRQQHVPPGKPNAPGNCFVMLRASVLYRTELPREDTGSLARCKISVRELHLVIQMENGRVDVSKQARLLNIGLLFLLIRGRNAACPFLN